MRRLLRIFSFIFLVLSAQCVLADNPMPIKLRMTALVNNRHAYYVALLDESLRAAGYLPQIELLDPMPQQRQWAAVKTGELTLAWGVQTTERDKEFVGVNNRLTNGLIGLRVFLVPKTSKEAYAHVRTLSDLRALKKIGGAGDGWFDVELWRLNRLPLEVFKGDWNRLFGMVAAGNRGVDYMIRGAHEAVIDVQSNPDLVIEPHLLLSHDRDMRIYMGPSNSALRPILEDALARADRSGLKRRLLAEHLLPMLESLKLESRVHLKLKTPAP